MIFPSLSSALTAGGVFALSLALGYAGVRRLLHARERWHAAQARLAWLDAREALFELVAQHELSAKSPVFQILFRAQEFVLHHPDAYDDVAIEIRAVSDRSPEGYVPPWLETTRDWSPSLRTAIARVLEDMSRGSALLASSHPAAGARAVRLVMSIDAVLLACQRHLCRHRRASRAQTSAVAAVSRRTRRPVHVAPLMAIRTECDLLDGSAELYALAQLVASPAPALTVVE